MENETRGLGIIVTMTEDRDGWDTDVLKLEEMFRYLNVDTEYHFDLSSQVSANHSVQLDLQKVTMNITFCVMVGIFECCSL